MELPSPESTAWGWQRLPGPLGSHSELQNLQAVEGNLNSSCLMQKSGLFPSYPAVSNTIHCQVQSRELCCGHEGRGRKGVVSEQGTEKGSHRAYLTGTVARSKVRRPEGVYSAVFSTAHKYMEKKLQSYRGQWKTLKTTLES